MPGFLTTAQAADALGISASRVRRLCAEGTLPAVKFGRDLAIDPADLARVSDRGKPGWPKGRPHRRQEEGI